MVLIPKKKGSDLEKILQAYCLRTMGITTWQRRSAKSQYLPKDFLVLIPKEEEPLSVEKNQLLIKMLQALNWEAKDCQIEWIEQSVLQMVDLHRWRIRYQPKKILLMGVGLDKQASQEMAIPYACVPSLSQLLRDKQQKRQAWQVMQPLIRG